MNCNNEYLGKYISLIHRQANVFLLKNLVNFDLEVDNICF